MTNGVLRRKMYVLEGMASSFEDQLPATATIAGGAEDARAKAKLLLTIDPSNYFHIKQAVTTWTTPKDKFNDSAYTREISLLINIRLETYE